MNIEQIDEHRLAANFAQEEGYRRYHVNRKVGNVYFADAVHQEIVPFVAECVQRMGLSGLDIVITRESRREEGGLINRGLSSAAHENGAQFEVDGETVASRVSYSRRTTLTDMDAMTLCDLRFDARLIETTLVHELHHLAIPKALEPFVQAITWLMLVADGRATVTRK